MRQPYPSPLITYNFSSNPWAPQGLFSHNAILVYLALFRPLGRLGEARGNKTGLYAVIMAIIAKVKVVHQIGTYSAYSCI